MAAGCRRSGQGYLAAFFFGAAVFLAVPHLEPHFAIATSC